MSIDKREIRKDVLAAFEKFKTEYGDSYVYVNDIRLDSLFNKYISKDDKWNDTDYEIRCAVSSATEDLYRKKTLEKAGLRISVVNNEFIGYRLKTDNIEKKENAEKNYMKKEMYLEADVKRILGKFLKGRKKCYVDPKLVAEDNFFLNLGFKKGTHRKIERDILETMECLCKDGEFEKIKMVRFDIYPSEIHSGYHTTIGYRLKESE